MRSTAALTVLALAAFAANSILCRLALADGAIDPASFTALRLASGAAALAPLALAPAARAGKAAAPWRPAPAVALFAYALGFSLAYVTLSAGTGALLLFGFVQLTMLAAGWARGERPGARALAGAALALGGVAWLVAPGLAAPDPAGAALMAGAGVAWGAYSLLGRGVARPVSATARNFALAAPLGLAAPLLAPGELVLTSRGALLAIASGALTSGLGYVVWYAALRGHTRASAAVVQLAVPLLAALGGVAFLGEEPSLRLAGSALLTLGGVALAIGRPRATPAAGERQRHLGTR